ncbi:cAMP-dependent protein kinase subunit [Haplosporangium bisporale]|nr:cAMP-dependent protein kinase subunit [Haplosporangium bisporale]
MKLHPSKCLESPEVYGEYASNAPNQGRFALIILNQPILIQRHLFENDLRRWWRKPPARFDEDGGRARKLVRERDSIQSSTAAQGTQDTTTATLSHEQLLSQNLNVVVLGGSGGRFDQSMSSIHHLYILSRERHATLVSDESIIVVLGAGTYEITCNLEIEGPTCGIIPVGSSVAHLTTTGLQNWETSFGTQISTSNALTGPNVTIHTDAPVVWTTELRSSN